MTRFWKAHSRMFPYLYHRALPLVYPWLEWWCLFLSRSLSLSLSLSRPLSLGLISSLDFPLLSLSLSLSLFSLNLSFAFSLDRDRLLSLSRPLSYTGERDLADDDSLEPVLECSLFKMKSSYLRWNKSLIWIMNYNIIKTKHKWKTDLFLGGLPELELLEVLEERLEDLEPLLSEL